MVSRVKTVFFWTMLYLVFEKFWWVLKPTIPPPGYAPYVGTLWTRYSSTVGRLQMLLSVSRLLAFFVSSPSYSRRTYSREGTRDVGTYQTFLSSCATTTLFLLFRAMTPNRKKVEGGIFLPKKLFVPSARDDASSISIGYERPQCIIIRLLSAITRQQSLVIFFENILENKKVSMSIPWSCLPSAPKKPGEEGGSKSNPTWIIPPSPFPTCFAPTDRKKNFFLEGKKTPSDREKGCRS